MKEKYRVFLLDTETKTHNHYLAISIRNALRRHPQVEKVILGEHGTAIKTFSSEKCDVFMAFGGAGQHAPLLTRLCCLSKVSILWTTEDPYDLNRNLMFSKAFDLVYTNDLACVPRYNGRAKHLPLAGSEDFHDFDVLQSDEDYRYDLLFVGTAWPNRVETINAILSAFSMQLKMKIALPYNQYLPKPKLEDASLIFNWRCASSEFAKLMNRSRVVLSLQRRFTLDSEDLATGTTPPPRLFEAALAGGYQVFLSDSEEACHYFQRDQEFGFCTTEAEAIETIKEALNHPAKRMKAARRSRQRALKEHTYFHRVKTMLEDVASISGRVSVAKNVQAATNDNLVVLVVTHNVLGYRQGGGIEVYQEALKSLGRKYRCLYLFPLEIEDGHIYRVIDSDNECWDYFVAGPCAETTLHDGRFETIFQRILFEKKVDLVHFQHLLGYPLSLPVIASACGLPVFWTLHDYYLICNRFNLLNYRDEFCDIGHRSKKNCTICLNAISDAPAGAQIRRQNFIAEMAKHIDGFIANTPYSAAYFLRVYPSVPKEKVHVVEMITPHYVRAAHKLPKRAKETARLRVMIPGNFTVGKGGNQMIRIFNVMREAAIEFTIMGWIEPHFQEVLAQLHIPNLNILGGYEQKNALQLFQNYDVSLHLSIWPETYMISLSEAWICGVIPIVTDLGAPGERVTDGVDGLKVPVNDSGAVIDALERLTYDMDYREKLRTGILRKKHGTEREHLNLLRKRYSHLIRQYPVPHINANDRSLVTYDLTLCDTGIRTNAPDWHTNDNHWDEKMPCETLEMSDEAANRVFNAIPTKYSHLKREKLSANSAEHTILIDQIMADEEPEKPSEKNIWATRNMLISGWAYKDAYGPCLDLYAQLKRANSVFVVKAQMDRRPDVASYLDKPDALHSGFSVFWELSSLPAGKYHFSVVQIYDGLIADFNDLFTVRIEQKTKALDTIPHAIPAEYAHFKIQQWSKWEGEELLVHIDQIAVDGGKIENNVRLFHSDKSIAMSGWAFWKNSGQALDTYIRLRGDNEDFIFPAEIEKRPDVAEFFGDKAAIHSGFRISAYVASLPSGNYALDVIQVYEDLVVEFKDLLAIALKARKAA